MAFFFRVVQDGDRWLAKQGWEVIDAFPTAEEAIATATALAAASMPSRVYLHTLGQAPLVIGDFPAPD